MMHIVTGNIVAVNPFLVANNQTTNAHLPTLIAIRLLSSEASQRDQALMPVPVYRCAGSGRILILNQGLDDFLTVIKETVCYRTVQYMHIYSTICVCTVLYSVHVIN